MGDYLIGRDPLQIEDHWQTLYRGGGGKGFFTNPSYSRQMPILPTAALWQPLAA